MNGEDDLGKRLLAALLSYQMGNKGVDRVLGKLRKGRINSKWAEIAMDLLAKMGDDIATTKITINKPRDGKKM